MDGQVLECLRATLSPDQGTRRNAEEQLKQLFQHPGQFQLDKLDGRLADSSQMAD